MKWAMLILCLCLLVLFGFFAQTTTAGECYSGVCAGGVCAGPGLVAVGPRAALRSPCQAAVGSWAANRDERLAWRPGQPVRNTGRLTARVVRGAAIVTARVALAPFRFFARCR